MHVNDVYVSASLIREVRCCTELTLLQRFFNLTLRPSALAGGQPDQRLHSFIAALDFALEHLHKITGTVFDV